MEKQKIMILTAPYGNGHIHAAKALVEEIKKYDHLTCIQYDLYEEEYPLVAFLGKKFLIRQHRKGIEERIYRYMYYKNDKILKSKLGKFYLNFGITKLIEKIKEEKPDIIINTFPVGCTYQLQEYGIEIPVYNVITDYAAIETWVNPNVKKHFIATSTIIDKNPLKAVDPSQFVVSGIPIRDVFYEQIENKSALYKKYNLDSERKTILLTTGALGVSKSIAKSVKLFQDEDNIQLLIVCGKNKKLYRKLKRIESKTIHVFGYVENINELMSVADLLVTKPGGITVTEAANIGVPLLFFKPIWGQEFENALFFCEKHAAEMALEEEEIYYKSIKIVHNQHLLNEMKENIKSIAIPHSAKKIIDKIIAR